MSCASALQWTPGSGQVAYAELALDFESHSNQALPAKPGHRHTRPVLSLRSGRACCGRRSTCCSPCLPAGPCWRETSGGCAPLGAPGGLPQHGAYRAAGLCVPARHTAPHAAAPAAVLGAPQAPAVDPRGRPQGLFPGVILATSPGRRGPGAPVRDREGSGSGPAAPATAADVRPAPCRLCPIHLKPQCEQCQVARRGVAHCCARGHEGHPVAVVGADASSRVLQAWLAPLEPPSEPPAKRPCMAPVPAAEGRGQRLDCRSPSPPARRGRVQSTLPWVRNTPPPPGSGGHPNRGGGGGSVRAESLNGSGLMGPGGQLHPPHPPPGAALDGGGRGRPPFKQRFYRHIPRVGSVPSTARLPPTPHRA